MQGSPLAPLVSVAMAQTAPWIVSVWGVSGVLILLSTSVFRLAERAAGLQLDDLEPIHWAFEVVWLFFMLYSEAWKGFHQRFSPRVVQRALELPRKPLLMLLAPPVCMGLIYGTRKRLAVSWGVIIAIVILVLLVRQFPSPWRELTDVGVAAGLCAGTLSVVWFAVRAAMGHPPGVDADFPKE